MSDKTPMYRYVNLDNGYVYQVRNIHFGLPATAHPFADWERAFNKALDEVEQLRADKARLVQALTEMDKTFENSINYHIKFFPSNKIKQLLIEMEGK